jgi:DNA-binding MarR family transcriptional regulator
LDTIERALDDFIEGLFRLMLEHHQAQVLEMDLTVVQAQALKLLRTAPMPASRLAAALGISAPAMTQLTDRLSRKNLIERRTVSTDRRAVIVALTDKGGRVIDGFRRRRNEVFADILLRLGNEDRLEAAEALSKLAAVLHGREPERGVNLSRRQVPVRQPGKGRTAVEPAQASKEVEGAPVSPPTKRRMRIEWD